MNNFILHFKESTDVQLNQSSITETKDPQNYASDDESGITDPSPPTESNSKPLTVRNH